MKRGVPGTEETRTLVRGAPRPKPLGAVVRAEGSDRAQPGVLRLRSGSVVIGSAPPSDMIISEATVSRRHVELSLVPEGVLVRDLGSRNGVFYQGHRVESIVLAFGGRVDVGSVKLAIDVDVESLGTSAPFAGSEYRGMVGTSAPMRALFGLLERLEGSLVTVLVQGESGVGKELVAQALHEGSSVARGPLVTVNCGAIARELIASELFGHRKGAFTGASDHRKGAFESADGGTLFLDEIGELPLDVQPMMLRALESGEIRPVGGDAAKHVRVRVICATHRDLQADAQIGRFREDLYYRLGVIRLVVPPLRDRTEDIEPIALRFAKLAGLETLPADIVAQLCARAWPGNVRELRNALQAYAALGILPDTGRRDDSVLEGLLARGIDVTSPYADQKDVLVDRFTRVYLRALLAHTQGNQSVAAKLAGLDRGYLGRLVAKYGLAK